METPNFIEARRKMALEGLKYGVIDEAEYSVLDNNLDNLEKLYRITQIQTDRIYGEIVKKQSTIKLKGE